MRKYVKMMKFHLKVEPKDNIEMLLWTVHLYDVSIWLISQETKKSKNCFLYFDTKEKENNFPLHLSWNTCARQDTEKMSCLDFLQGWVNYGSEGKG